MQQVAPNQNSRTGGSSQASKIVIIAIILFALSGMMFGFAYGAFTRPHNVTVTSTPAQTITSHKVSSPTVTQTPTTNVLALGVGCPSVTPNSYSQVADGQTSYTITAQPMDKSINHKTACGQGNPLSAPDLTCKIWITKDQDGVKLTKNDLNPVSNLQDPFPKEITNAFNFSTGSQVQSCAQKGPTTWTYTLSPTLQSGTYLLGVVTDWKGQAYNWDWKQISIKGQ